MVTIRTEQNKKTQQVNASTPVQQVKNKDSKVTVPVGEKKETQTVSNLKVPNFSEKVQTSVMNIEQTLGLKHYNLSLTKDSNSMLRKSQTNLIDLIKYYDGDPDYYYEGYTSVYPDTFGKKTTGFGHYYPAKNIKSQEDAYATLAKDLTEADKVLRNKIGKDKYNSLPLSIREALIDLAFNKGPDKISKKPELMAAIKNNDYSKIVANLYFYTSGSNSADKSREEAGLYRRSLSRAILATRDLKGKELEEAKKEIDNLYKKARKFYVEKAPNKNVEDLDNVYKCFKNEPITSKTKNADNFKVTVEKGKGLYSTANDAYKTLNTTAVTMYEYRKAFYKLNKIDENNPPEIKAGEELIAPSIKNVKAILGEQTETIADAPKQEVSKPDTSKEVKADTSVVEAKEDSIEQKPVETKTETKSNGSFWGGALSVIAGAGLGLLTGIVKKVKNPKLAGLAVLGAGIGFGIYKLAKSIFGSNDKIEEEPKTAFQKMLKNPDTKVTTDGDFEIVTLEHEVVKGNTIYSLSKEYQISQNIICENNKIENPDLIKLGQKLKIEKIGYKVKDGENISKIAEKLGLNEEILRDINELEEDVDVKEDQIIELPGFTHTVVQGETLYGISKKVGVSIEKLKELNKMSSDIIHPGDKIKVIFNNSDFDVPDSMKKETYNPETKETEEITDVSKKYRKDFERNDILPETRKILKQVRRINGKVAATREVLTAEKLNVQVKSNKLKGKTIIVNAGHGYKEAGIDRGAPAIGDINDEWLLNANNSIRLAKELCANGAKVIFIQGREKVVPLISNEIKKEENKADLFISVHVNAFEGKTQDRTQVYFSNPLHELKPKNNINAKSKKLAQIVEKNFDKWIPKHEKIDKNDAFFLDKAKTKQDYAQLDAEPLQVCNTSENYQHIPAILWEVSFMAAEKGRERLKDDKLMNDYAKVMSKSIIDYFN